MADSILGSSGLASVPKSSEVTTISNWAAPYATDLLSSTQALANAPMPAYTGQLTAGAAPLQEQAWQGLSNLTVPQALLASQENLYGVSQAALNLPYKPTTFTDTYKAPAAYTPTSFQNQFSAPGQYTPINATTGTFGTEQAQQYMNPYIKASLDPQIEEARRQSMIQAQLDASKMVGAGAFGGSRQAIMDSERERNLMTNLANITGQGYNTAYTTAQQQFNADQARQLQAQQANIQQAEFGAQQGMTAAQLMAQYGLSAQQANEVSRQYGYTQSMTQAQQDSAAEQARQAATQAANQFGATYGLQGLQASTSASQALANAGAQEAQYGLANLQALGAAGTQQQALNQAGLTAQYNQYLKQLEYPQTMLKLQKDILTNLPVTTKNTYGAVPGVLQQAAGGIADVASMVKDLKAAGVGADAISNLLGRLNVSSSESSSAGSYPLDNGGTMIISPDGVQTMYNPDGTIQTWDAAGNYIDPLTSSNDE